MISAYADCDLAGSGAMSYMRLDQLWAGLEQEPGPADGVVFVFHRLRDGIEVRLVAFVSAD